MVKLIMKIPRTSVESTNFTIPRQIGKEWGNLTRIFQITYWLSSGAVVAFLNSNFWPWDTIYVTKIPVGPLNNTWRSAVKFLRLHKLHWTHSPWRMKIQCRNVPNQSNISSATHKPCSQRNDGHQKAQFQGFKVWFRGLQHPNSKQLQE